jgi:hypothetical protein
MALGAGSLPEAEAAARELRYLDDEDSLRLLTLLFREGERRYERAAVRFPGCVLATHPAIGFIGAGDLLSGLEGRSRAAGGAWPDRLIASPGWPQASGLRGPCGMTN